MMVRIRSWVAIGARGLTRKSTAPSATPRYTHSGSASAVRRMMGILEQPSSLWIRSITENPLGPRCRQMSSTTTAISRTCLRTWSMPSQAVAARRTR